MSGVARPRIQTLDIMRGYFMSAIIIDHIVWSPSLLFFLTGGGVMFVSMTEGFFVISGILVGYIYGPRMLHSVRSTFIKLWQRGLFLYVLSLLFTVIFLAWATLLNNPPGTPPVRSDNISHLIVNTLAARYSYGWTDFLPRYAVFMLFAPFVLYFITKRLWWLMLILSTGIWFFLREMSMFSPFAAWQILFVFGICVGYYLPSIEKWAHSLPVILKKTSIILLWSFSTVTIILSLVAFIVPLLFSYEIAPLAAFVTTFESYFTKGTLEIGRLLLGTLWFWSLYIFCRSHEKTISRLTGGFLETIGKNSLFVYGLHAFVIFGCLTLFGWLPINDLLLNTTIGILIIGGIYLLTRKKKTILTLLRRAVGL